MALAFALVGCRGQPSEDPPITPIRDMRNQPKYRPQAASPFFPDGRTVRPAVEGTVAQGALRNDEAYYQGKTAQGYVARAPVEVTERTLKRGQERYDIYCAACHDRSGAGRGIVVQRGFPPPVDLASERVRHFSDGEVFEVMTNGVRNMPSYAAQLPVEDRWAIVAYLRALQRSQAARLDDVPVDRRGLIEPEAK